MEDEIHFFLKCPALKEARKRLVKPVLKTNPGYKKMSDVDKMSWLLNQTEMKEFGQMLCGMFDTRQDIMFKKKRTARIMQ